MRLEELSKPLRDYITRMYVTKETKVGEILKISNHFNDGKTHSIILK